MVIKQPESCPVCNNHLTITKISCERCHTELSGKFPQCKYCALDERHSIFLETFLRCRGNIKEIEKELNISYPTVKNLIEEMLIALDISVPDENTRQVDIQSILELVESGEISAAEGSKRIRAIKQSK